MDARPIPTTARSLRLGAQRARFELWAKRLDARLRRADGRRRLDAPHGAHFYEAPRVEVLPFAGASVVRGGEYPGGYLYAGSPLEAVRAIARDQQASSPRD